MSPAIYLTARPLSPLFPGEEEARVAELAAYLEIAFPAAQNKLYFEALRRGPLSTVRQRLEALSLLPSLLASTGIDPSLLCLSRDTHGRPYLYLPSDDGERRISDVDFNLSHTATYVACGLSVGGGQIGVDIEGPIPPDRCRRLAERYATEGERRLLSENLHMDFSDLWTMREALGKRDGRGRPLEQDASIIPSDTTIRIWHLPDSTTLTLAMAHDLPSDVLNPIDLPSEVTLEA